MRWEDLLMPLLQTIITVFAPILFGALALWLKQLITKTKAELSTEELALLTQLSQQFVLAAEQSGLTGRIRNLGFEKKAFVLKLLQDEANRRNIKIDVSVLDALIESAVVEAFGTSEKYLEPAS